MHERVRAVYMDRALELASRGIIGDELTDGEDDGRSLEARPGRRIRAHLLHERGLAPASLYTRGYWQVGEANHPDHDYGEDVT